jgi:signal transduction histidine kinase
MFYFTAGVFFFQGIYVFTQWRKYRKKEYLYYCYYLMGLIAYFFIIFNNHLFQGSELSETVLPLIKMPLVLFSFFLYTLFVEHFIEMYRYPLVHMPLKLLKLVTLVQVATTPLTGIFGTVSLHFWHFGIGNIVIMILALIVILRLMTVGQPLAVYILRGSLCALAGTLLTNIFNGLTELGAKQPMDWNLAMAPAIVGLLLESYFFLTGLNYKSFKAEEEITRKNERLLLEKQMIRNKIAQDLHDDIGASLSSIHIYSSVAEKEMSENPEKAKAFLQQINQSTRQVMENMSDIVWAMETEHTESRSFSSRIKNFGYGLLTQKNIDCNYMIDPEAEQKIVDLEARKNILLIVKEALNNIAKYSAATRAEVRIVDRDGYIHGSITDNGKGFDSYGLKAGNGIRNMKQRSASLGGKFNVVSTPGHGTIIQFSIPIANISGR